MSAISDPNESSCSSTSSTSSKSSRSSKSSNVMVSSSSSSNASISTSTGSLPQVIVTDKGTFQLGPRIGKGGFGVVYQGLHVDGGAFVAIKQFKFDAGTEDQKESLMAEIDLLRSLNHPNIVHYITYSIVDNYFNIVMEFVENGSLLKIRDIFGKLPETLVAVYMSQVLVGLTYLHEQGVIHRDIKGANLLVTKDGTIKIADFGISSKLGSTRVEDVNGTPYWMAPEIIELNGATPKSDIWSVGCTVIELLTGEPPYSDLSPVSVLFHIVQDEHPPLPEEWLLSAFKKDPTQRPSAKDLLDHKWLKDAKESQEKSQISLGMDGAKRFVTAAKSIRKSVILKRKSICMDLNALQQQQDGYSELFKEIAAQDNAQANEAGKGAKETEASKGREKGTPKSQDSKKSDKKEPLLSLNSVIEGTETPNKSSRKLQRVQARKSVRYVDELSNILKGLDDTSVTNSPTFSPSTTETTTDATTIPPPPTTTIPITVSSSSSSSFMQSNDLNDLNDLLNGNDDDEEESFPVLALSASASTSMSPAANLSTSPPGSAPTLPDMSKSENSIKKNVVSLAVPKRRKREKSPLPSPSPPPPNVGKLGNCTDKIPVVVVHRKASRRNTNGSDEDDATINTHNTINGDLNSASNSGSGNKRGVSCEVSCDDTLSPTVHHRSHKDKRTAHTESLPPQPLTIQPYDLSKKHRMNAEDTNTSITGSSDSADDDLSENIQLSHNIGTGNEQIKYIEILSKNEFDEDEDDDDVEIRAIRETRGMLQESILKAYRTFDDVKCAKDSDMIKALETLDAAVTEYSVVKEGAFQQVGLGPIIDILREIAPTSCSALLLTVLTTINRVTENSKSMQTLLGFSGGIYIIGTFVGTKSQDVLERLITFYFQLFQDSPMLFLTCGGVSNVVSLLRGACGTQMNLIPILQLILTSLREEKKTPLCDIAKTYVREDLLTVLPIATKKAKSSKGQLKLLGYIICELATADTPVKRAITQRGFVRPLLDLFAFGNSDITLAAARAVEALTCDEECIDNLIAENVIKALMDLLDGTSASSNDSETTTTLQQRIFSAISNIIRLKPTCQNELLKAGIVPVLVKATDMKGVRDVAIPLLCSLIKTAHKREVFAKNKAIETLVQLVMDDIYRLNAFETISLWLQVDPSTIKSKLSHSKEVKIFARSFERAEDGVWQMLLTPFLIIIKQSHTIAQKLGEQPELMDSIVKRLESDGTVHVRLLLDMLEELFVKTKDKKAKKELVSRYNLIGVLENVSKLNSEKIVITLKIKSLLKIIQSDDKSKY